MKAWIPLLCCLALLLACGRPDPEVLPEPEPQPEAPPPPPPPPQNLTYVKEPTARASDAHGQAIILATDVTRVLALGSGLGENSSINNKTRARIAEILEIDYEPTKGARPFVRVFAAGSPRLPSEVKTTLYPTNWETWRWIPASIDRSTPLSVAVQTLIAELFASDILLNRDPLTDRYDGLLLGIAAGQQAEHLQFNARTGNTYTDLDEEGQPIDGYIFLNQVRMLTMLSRFALYADRKDYAGTMTRGNAEGYANQLFNQIVAQQKRQPDLYQQPAHGLRELIEAYSLFAAISDAYKWQLLSLSHLRILTDAMQAKMGAGGMVREANASQLPSQAYAYRSTGSVEYKDRGIEAWQGMLRLWDEKAGAFRPSEDEGQFTLTPADFADGFLAINAAKHIFEQDTGSYYTTLLNTVLQSGIVPAEVDSHFPTVPDAIENLRAPSFVARMQYDGSQWHVQDGSFHTGPAMALAAALIQGAEDEGGDYRIADFGFPRPRDLETADNENLS